MDLTIIGVGYVGLVTGSCMAEMGHKVTCLDIDENKVEALNRGDIPFYEKGLKEIVLKNIAAKRLLFTTSYSEAIQKSELCFICVDTPTCANNHADLTYVKAVAKSIAENMNDYKIIVNKSTVPVGTAKIVREIIQEVLDNRNVNFTFDVVSNPEFLAEGNAVDNCMKPDRIILGIDNESVTKVMKELYSPFMISHDRLLIMDVISAEMTKYAANLMLASRISLMNEFAELCEKMGANIDFVRKGIGSDNRIGVKYLYPGIGFGGSCLPKDLRALISLARDFDCKTPILNAIQEVNEKQKQLLGKKIINYFEERSGISNKTIGILGLAFKPDTDDMREAPSLALIQQLLEVGCKIRVFDPIAMDKAKKILKNSEITWCLDEKKTAEGADALVLVTEWKQFRFLNFEEIKKLMNYHVVFDGRNQYSFEKMQEFGFDYISIGRPSLIHSFENTGHYEN